jgi:hypothetical protein
MGTKLKKILPCKPSKVKKPRGILLRKNSENSIL